jgi:hypothetical protein
MSLLVVYNGQRKVIKIPSPNTLVQNILVDAAQQFNVEYTKAVLQHKRTVLDNSQPFRFSGLSNNAQVDLVVSAAPVGLQARPCKIALAVDGWDNITETLDSSLTLMGVLKQLVATARLPSDTLERTPELVYLRASYKGEQALEGMTLAGLGLAG